MGQEPMKIKLTGEDLPQYDVVSMFFMHVNNVLGQPDISQKTFLSKIGVEHDSPAEEFLVLVTRKAVEIVVRPNSDFSLRGEEYRRYQFEEMKKKARDLAIVYRNLLEGLEESGVDSEKIEQYCENVMRPNVSHSSTGDTFESYMEAVKEFDKELAADNDTDGIKEKQQ
jgi:hypothetical protein